MYVCVFVATHTCNYISIYCFTVLSRFILENVKDFQELVILSEKKLEEILGNNVNAKLLWNCLHNKPKPPTITSHSTNTHRGRGKGRKGKRGQ